MTDSSTDTRRIRHDIDRTQREMSRTIDEIGVRLSPDYIMHRTKESARRAAVNKSRTLMDKVKANPIPAAMVGVGLFLMMRSDDRDTGFVYELDDVDHSSLGSRDWEEGYGRTHEAHGRLREGMDEARERVSGAVDTAKERVSSVMDSAREHVSDMAHNARSGSRSGMYRARTSSQQFLTDSPLIAGVAAIALGAIIGAVLPESEREDRLFGEKRDELLSRGKELARDGVDRAKNLAQSAATAATTAVKDEVKSTKNDTPQDFTTSTDLHI
jgi:uncharacterized protein YjbJ (UPF0337 family)